MTEKAQNCISVLKRAQRKWAKNATAVRSVLEMNMHELLASGSLLVTCVAQSGLRASGVTQGVVVELSINMTYMALLQIYDNTFIQLSFTLAPNRPGVTLGR